jgi:adenylylsulfate kinase-like enzyme
LQGNIQSLSSNDLTISGGTGSIFGTLTGNGGTVGTIVSSNAGTWAIAALISPYRDDRERARRIIGESRFIEVYLATPLAMCESRDPKGLYRRVRAGEIANFTGISDPYEAPLNPALRFDTAIQPLDDCVLRTLALLSCEPAHHMQSDAARERSQRLVSPCIG